MSVTVCVVWRKCYLLCNEFIKGQFHILVLRQLKKMEESHQEATAKEVERILGLLQTHFRNDRKYDSASMALI